MKDSNHRFWIGATAGLIATFAMSVVMMVEFIFVPQYLPEPLPFALLARLVGRMLPRDTVDGVTLALAIPLHFAYGALWAGGTAVSAAHINWKLGLLIGLGMWLIMAIFLMPLAGGATFSVATSPWPWISTLILHAIYGAAFGALVDRATRAHHPHGEPDAVAPDAFERRLQH